MKSYRHIVDVMEMCLTPSPFSDVLKLNKYHFAFCYKLHMLIPTDFRIKNEWILILKIHKCTDYKYMRHSHMYCSTFKDVCTIKSITFYL